MKRVMIYIVLVVMTSTLLSCQKIVENRVKKGLNRQKLEILKDDKMHVFLVGSGGPMNNAKRVATSTGIIAGGTFLLVDVGPGTWRNADLLNLALGHLSTILLTHFHSDHICPIALASFQNPIKKRLLISRPFPHIPA